LRPGLAVAAACLVATCASQPQAPLVADLPAGITDARGRFAEILCAVLEDHGRELPDYRACDETLAGAVPAGPGRPVGLGPSRRGLVAAVVRGIGYDCIRPWLEPPSTGADNLRRFGYGLVEIRVDALSGTSRNASRIRDAIMSDASAAGGPRLVLFGYSKGAPDVLEAIVRYPEIRGRIAAFVSVAGAVRGSPLADDAQQWQADFFRLWPKAECDAGDGGGVESLRPAVRNEWLAQNRLPASIPYYTVVAMPRAESISRVLRSTYKKLARIDARNDSQVIYADQFVPGSTLVATLEADHWAVSLPISRSHPFIGRHFVDRSAYPREALLEALLRFLEEDLDRLRLQRPGA
jgi:hypothetical protein